MSGTLVLEELQTFCYMVKRGKPAASVAFPERYLEQARGIAIQEGLAWCADNYYPGWYSFTVYLKPHMQHVITKAPVFEDPVVEAWYWGKVYGYGDEAIASYTDELRPPALRARRQGIGGVVQPDKLAIQDALVGSNPRMITCGRHIAHLLSRIARRADHFRRSR